MGLIPEYRGQGIGKRLVELYLSLAKTFGLEKVELEVFAENLPAIKIYEQFRFVEEGKKKRSRKLDDIHQDVLLMGLILA